MDFENLRADYKSNLNEDDIVKNLNFICNSISKISNLLANTDFNYKVLIFNLSNNNNPN